MHIPRACKANLQNFRPVWGMAPLLSDWLREPETRTLSRRQTVQFGSALERLQ